MIEYIFHIGIIYIVFGIIWAFFLMLYNMLTNFNGSAGWQTFVIKTVKTYFLVSIVAVYTIIYMRKPEHNAGLIATVGLLTLYSYLVGRLQQQRMMVQINGRMGRLNNSGTLPDLRVESALVIAGLVYFTTCLFNHTLPFNSANLWFYDTVQAIYATPVIGWIIGFFGIIFLLSTLFKAVLLTAMFFAYIQNLFSGGNRGKGPGNNRKDDGSDDGYTDYEIVE